MLRTQRTQEVLSFLLEQHGTGGVFGWEIIQNTEGVGSGTLYPILAKLEEAGWVVSNWEDSAVAAQEKRPRRRYYWLTGTGATKAPEYCAPRERPRGGGQQPHAPGAPA